MAVAILATLLLPSLLFSSATVSGVVSSPSGAFPQAGANFVLFELQGCGNNPARPTQPAEASQLTLAARFAIDSSTGAISGTIIRNDQISCGGVTTSTFYLVTTYINNQPVQGSAQKYRITSGAFSLNNATPITTNPVVAAPTGDSTYARLDGGNTPFTGPETFNAAVTNNSTVANNGAVINSSTVTTSGAVTNNSTTALNGVVTATAGLSANGTVTPQVYGAKADVVTLTDGAITSGTAAFSSATASFTVADVGKAIVVHGAGAAAADLVTTISAFVSSTAVTLTANAGTTSSAALAYYGTDDTGAIKTAVAAGVAVGKRTTCTNGSTFMMSNTASTVQMFGTGTGGILDGSCTIIFAPTGALTGGVNDRFLYIKSAEATPIRLAAGAIAKGATSFTANAAGDVSSWAKGDWLILCERDAAFGDCLYVDWVQVSSIASATVNILTPFRMAFPNARTWNVSGSPAACTTAGPCGLSARKVTGITSATLRDFHVIIPNIPGGISGVVTRDTRGVVIDNVTIDDASGNSLATYLDQGLRLNTLHINNVLSSEIAGTVDFSISGLQSQMVGTALNGFAVPTATCLTIDIGSGFGTFANSNCGPAPDSSIFLNGGIHDLTVNGNHVGWVKGTNPGGAIECIACYRVVYSANVLDGGGGSSVGIGFLDSGAYTVTVNSDSNQAIGNVINGFPTNISCAGVNSTDNCDDYSATTAGLRTIRNAQMVGLLLAEGGTALVNGANNNVVPVSANGASAVIVYASGPTGVFSVSGFTGGKDGRELILYNSAAFAMTITNEGAASTAANRIKTLTGADVTLRAGTSMATFVYLAADSRWILVATN